MIKPVRKGILAVPETVAMSRACGRREIERGERQRGRRLDSGCGETDGE
jgi:hypothetical protein